MWLSLRCALWPVPDVATHAGEIDAFFSSQTHDPVAVLIAEDENDDIVGFACFRKTL